MKRGGSRVVGSTMATLARLQSLVLQSTPDLGVTQGILSFAYQAFQVMETAPAPQII